MARSDPLARYRAKRDFRRTPEPAEGGEAGGDTLRYVIQKHWASHLHYDLRLEIGGTMKSWAVPKGPSLDPKDKRMAVQVEDHPIAYNRFEGQIPAGQYGAGRVIVWDSGTWAPEGDPAAGWRKGKLKFMLHGHKLQGGWTLVRMHGKGEEKQPPWLLIKEHDGFERPAGEYSIVDAQPDSVAGIDTPEPPPLKPANSAGRKAIPPSHRPLPKTLSPQLATLASAPPADAEDWLYELKFDGYRLLARRDGDGVQLFTRNCHDWTHRLPALAQEIARLPLRSGWLDGEIVVQDDQGAPDFQALQNAFDGERTDGIVYFVFDLPFADGEDLRSLPLTERRARLHKLLGGKRRGTRHIRFSEAFEAAPADLVASACRIGFEGVIGKRRDAPYASRRNGDWIKLKCSQRQEFVIAGWTDPQGSRTGLGALLLGVHGDDGRLRYAGNVGTGFSQQTLAALRDRLDALARKSSPFDPPPPGTARAHWVTPKLLAEVSFGEWTTTGRIRHAVFHGLRDDKPARAIGRERAVQPAARAARKTSMPRTATAGKLHVTHADRVIDPSTGLTKLDLVRYYATVAPLLLEHLRQRPVALVRAPAGVEGETFFQKHAEHSDIPGWKQLDPKLDPGHAPLLEPATAEALPEAAQFNVVELHSWNARHDRIERPDRIVFDLDPGEGVAWAQVQEGAQLVQVLLQELGLPAFLKTSGGKGLHVVVPIKRLHGWEVVKGFAQAVVQHLAQTIPDRFVAKSGPRNRVGRIFVDWLRNGRGATTVAAWSARARPGLGISVPVGWDELATLTGSAHWTIATVGQRLRTGNAPWQGYAASAVSITQPMRRLGL